MDEELYQNDPRDYALEMAAQGTIDYEYLALACLKYMSNGDVREMLDCNELSPRFDEEY